MKFKSMAAVVAFYTFAASSSVNAAPVSYSEAIDGELPQFSPFNQILALDTGINTITGHLMWPYLADNNESFLFSVPNGTLLTQIIFDFRAAPDGITNYLQLDWGLLFPTELVTNSPQLNGGSMGLLGTFSLWNQQLPLPEGEYAIMHRGSLAGTGGLGGNLRVEPGPEVFYSWRLYVDQGSINSIPEPTTLALFALGLAGLGVVGRKRESRRLQNTIK